MNADNPLPRPPKAYDEFVTQFPDLGTAWEHIHEAGGRGPLDKKTIRLIKLGIAIGAMREGSISSSVRKGLSRGITEEEMMQVVALAAGTLGLPSTVAVHTWIKASLVKAKKALGD